MVGTSVVGRSRAHTVFVMAGVFLMACGPVVGASADAGALDAAASETAAPDDATPMDAPVTTDGGRDGAPGDATRTDGGAPGDAPAVDTGMCGDPVRTCFCGCGSNATCQQGCINSNEDCSFCVLDAAAMCCPMESMAFFDCLDRTGCEDQSCINSMCGREQSAFNVCVTRRQTSDPACVGHVRVCLGADYPSIQCP